MLISFFYLINCQIPEYILYVYDNKEEMVKFNPGEVAKCTFYYVKGAKIYSYCNKHGLWGCEVE